MEPREKDESLSQEIRILAAIGYFPMFFLLPLLAKPNDKFCRFHAIQSGLLLATLVVFWFGVYILDFILGKVLANVILVGFVFKLSAWLIHYVGGTVVSLIYIILVIVCFIQAAAGQYWRIPVLSMYIERLRIGSV